jgi:hypothetical protein
MWCLWQISFSSFSIDGGIIEYVPEEKGKGIQSITCIDYMGFIIIQNIFNVWIMVLLRTQIAHVCSEKEELQLRVLCIVITATFWLFGIVWKG